MSYTNNVSGQTGYNYLVNGPHSAGPFATIQSAVSRAHSDGVIATVFVRPGTYTESLTLYDGVNIKGSEEGQVIIIGKHTPPAAGTFTISDCVLQSDTDIFNSAVAGTCVITVTGCTFAITTGYVFNLANWVGTLSISNCLDISTTNNIANNSGGAAIEIQNSTVGTGGGAGMVSTGLIIMSNALVFCPLRIANASNIDTCTLGGTITITGTAAVTIANCVIETGAAAAINATTTGVVYIADTSINCAAANSIIGTSTVDMASVTFLNNATTAVTITPATTSVFRCNELFASNGATILDGDLDIASGRIYLNGDYGTDGQTIIAKTGGEPKWASITSTDGTIGIALGANTIDLSASGGANWTDATVATNMVATNGYITKIAIPGILNYTLPLTAAKGTIIEVTGYSAGLYSILQNAGQSVHYAGSTTTVGVGGSLTATERYDSIKLLCVVADTEWNVLSSVGNFTIV